MINMDDILQNRKVITIIKFINNFVKYSGFLFFCDI